MSQAAPSELVPSDHRWNKAVPINFFSQTPIRDLPEIPSELNRYKCALEDIIAQEKPGSNATVRRMARIAKNATLTTLTP